LIKGEDEWCDGFTLIGVLPEIPLFWRGSSRVMKCWPKKKSAILLLSLLMLCMVNASVVGLAETKTGDTALGLTASLDRESVRVGDMVWLTLKYHLPEGARLPEKPQIKGIEGLTITERIVEDDHIKIRFLADQLGAWKSGTISLTYVDKDGNKKTMDAGSVSLTVRSNLGEKPEEARLRPIQDIVPIEPAWLTYLPWAAALAGLLFIIAALTWWYRKRRSRDILPEVIDPPHIRARKEIDRLVAQDLFETGKVKAFYFILSEILRRYIESIRHFPAAEYTTEEIAHHIRNNEEDGKILPLLRQADLVKFADTVPTPSRKDDDIQTALSYIQKTGYVKESDHADLEAREGAR
jgi:hypothetical protein